MVCFGYFGGARVVGLAALVKMRSIGLERAREFELPRVFTGATPVFNESVESS